MKCEHGYDYGTCYLCSLKNEWNEDDSVELVEPIMVTVELNKLKEIADKLRSLPKIDWKSNYERMVTNLIGDIQYRDYTIVKILDDLLSGVEECEENKNLG